MLLTSRQKVAFKVIQLKKRASPFLNQRYEFKKRKEFNYTLRRLKPNKPRTPKATKVKAEGSGTSCALAIP